MMIFYWVYPAILKFKSASCNNQIVFKQFQNATVLYSVVTSAIDGMMMLASVEFIGRKPEPARQKREDVVLFENSFEEDSDDSFTSNKVRDYQNQNVNFSKE